MSSPHADRTVTFAGTPGETTVSIAAPDVSKLAYHDELRQLLRSRLIIVHVLALIYIALMAVLSMILPDGEGPSSRPDQGNPWRLVPPLAQCLAGAIALWRSPGMTLRSLRLWEVVYFATHAAFHGWQRFEMLVFIAEDSPTGTGLKIGPAGGFSLFGFITLILAYGVLIPNTRLRSLLVVACITAVPFATLVAMIIVKPSLTPAFFSLVVQAAANLTFPAAIAVFAAARAAALQQRAFEAERRAEQVGQYTLKRKLGEGGMGEVWLAEHALLKRPCAVKFIRPDLASNPAVAARFDREVKAVTGLVHPNTVRVYDYGRADDGSFYFVMEYLDGPTLEDLVRETGPLPPARVVYLLRQVCGALGEAHSTGLVHRDLKPGNVIVAALGGQKDVAKLLDFGLVQDLSADDDDRLTRTGTVLGTPAYMSPEQASGEQTMDARGDLYSLGAVAFFALFGRPPFQGKSLRQILASQRSEIPPSVTDLQANVPVDLAAVVAQCLAKDPDARYQTALDLDRALAQCGCAAEWADEHAAK